MAFKYREEIVGKRFLCILGNGKLKLKQIADWEWRAGVIRAVTQRELDSQDVQIKVEFDGCDWTDRKWIKIHDKFQLILVESTLNWAQRKGLSSSSSSETNQGKYYWPAFSYKVLIDKTGVYKHAKQHPVEFLVDKHIEILDTSELKVYKENDKSIPSPAHDNVEVIQELHLWEEYQKGQSIFLATPTVLLGYRVDVYRSEGTTQWYSAVIKAYNENTKKLTVLDDTVLELHDVDPVLIQMRLIGDGVVDKILSGDIGNTTRSSTRSSNKRNSTEDSNRFKSVAANKNSNCLSNQAGSSTSRSSTCLPNTVVKDRNTKQKAETSKKQQTEKGVQKQPKKKKVPTATLR